MPLMREVKRFVRKCPKLISLGMNIFGPSWTLHTQPLLQNGTVNTGEEHGL
jgi:hypothetical protein